MPILRLVDRENRTYILVKAVKEGEEDRFLELNKGSDLFVKVDSLPESQSGYYKQLEDGSFVVDEEKELEYLKKERIEYLSNFVKDWILSQYPIEKQQADNHQAEYYGTAIILIRKQLIQAGATDLKELTTTDIYDRVADVVNRVKEGLTTISQEVEKYPEQEKFYWEQVFKAGIRKAWTVWCSQAFSLKKKEILESTSIEELENIQSLDLPELDTFLK